MKGILRVCSSACCVLLLCAAMARVSSAQTFTTLVNFNGTNGGSPGYVTLTQGLDGNYYGTTPTGGAHTGGTVFKISPQGTLTTVYNFCSVGSCADGSGPQSGVIQATNGNLYGTTSTGGTGTSPGGTVFELTLRAR